MSSLSGLAVRKFTEENIPLNKTIANIAEQEKLGNEHIARLVERSNRDTFLALYPEKTSFEVASVPAVLEALNRKKEARENSRLNRLSGLSGSNSTNYKLLALCKAEGNTKEAVVNNPNPKIQNLKSQIKRAIEELSFAARQKKAEMLDCEDKLVELTKQAVLRDSSFADLETYTLSTLDDHHKEASEALDGVHVRVKTMPFVGKRASERGRRREPFAGASNPYIDLVQTIIKNAGDVALLESGIKTLEKQL